MSQPSPSPDLSIYLSSLNGVDTAGRYAEVSRSLGRTAWVFAEPHIATVAAQLLGNRDVEIRALPAIEHGLRQRAYAFFRSFASGLVMGDNPANVNVDLPASAWRAGVVRRVRTAAVKPSPRTVNGLLTMAFGHALPPQFPTRHVLVISFPLEPIRLCRRGLVVDTVVDSWDHPVRRTAGYRSRYAIAWNADLGDDWRHFQGAEASLLGPPVRLEYALEKPLDTATGRRRLMYPVATSPHYPRWFADEMRLIRSVARCAAQAGWVVLVKPKPESRREDFEGLSEHPNVELGRFHDSQGTLDYHLSAEYNTARLAELQSVDVVVNALTTFGLDAACAGAPLLQLDLRDCGSLPTLAGVAGNHHLVAHLYRGSAPSLLRPSSLENLETELTESLEGEWHDAARTASDALRAWVTASQATDPVATMAKVLGVASRPSPVPRR